MTLEACILWTWRSMLFCCFCSCIALGHHKGRGEQDAHARFHTWTPGRRIARTRLSPPPELENTEAKDSNQKNPMKPRLFWPAWPRTKRQPWHCLTRTTIFWYLRDKSKNTHHRNYNTQNQKMPEFKNRDARKQHHLQSHLLKRNEPTKGKQPENWVQHRVRRREATAPTKSTWQVRLQMKKNQLMLKKWAAAIKMLHYVKRPPLNMAH